MINFFALDGDRFLVDLPGYGFASVPGEIRSQWHRLLEEYLKHREALKGIALIMDVRHPFTERDMQLIDYFRQTAKPIHVLLTKADKLSQTQANVALREAAKRLSQLSPLYSVQLFSSLKRTGLDEAETRFAQWLGGKPAPLEGSRHKQRPRVISVTRGRNKKPPG